MRQSTYYKVRDILMDNDAHFVGTINKLEDSHDYIGKIAIKTPHFVNNIRYSFDGSDKGFLEGIKEAFEPYTDLNKYYAVINDTAMTFSEQVTDECADMSENILSAIQPLLDKEIAKEHKKEEQSL